MENVPFCLGLSLVLVTLFTVLFFYIASNRSPFVLVILCGWLLLQWLIGSTGFYLDTALMPPRFLLVILPPLLTIALLFATKKGRRWIDNLDPKTLTLLHTVRIPVELILWGLAAYHTVPQLMTFEGRNFDILSGITAPLIWYFGYVRKRISKRMIILWNVICMGLLINIVTIAILSAPFPFQQLALDQPNIAVLHFPFLWLPACIVPLVLFSHLVAIRHLLTAKS